MWAAGRGKGRPLWLFVLLAAWLLGAVPVLAAPGDDAGPGTWLDERDAGRRVVLRTGEMLGISLSGNPSTGYRWEVGEIDERVLRPAGEAVFEPDSGLIGAAGRVTLRFQASRAGVARLRLVYRRPWESRPPARTFGLTVEAAGPAVVREDGGAEPATTSGPQRPAALGFSKTEDELPPAFDWCEQGDCTPVKDQGECGSCWAFASAGVFENVLAVEQGREVDLSEQYLISCNTDGWGCQGGGVAFDYYLDNVPPGEMEAGAVYESDFPYAAANELCSPPHPHQKRIFFWESVGASNPWTSDIKQAIFEHGPVYVTVCAGPEFSAYRDGVFEREERGFCNGTVNHGVILTGWDDGQGTSGVWRLRNSWGASWGEAGTMRIGYGVSNVGDYPAYLLYGSSEDVGPLVFAGVRVDDDGSGQSQGNGNGLAECGETVELYVDLRNLGDNVAFRVRAAARTDDPYLGWLYNDDTSFPDIAGGEVARGENDLDVTLAADTPDGHEIGFTLAISAANSGPWQESFSLPVFCDPAGNLPVLSAASRMPALQGRVASLPVEFRSNGHEVAGLSFSLDYDQTCLAFDPADNDGDGLPDGIQFSLPARFEGAASFDPAREAGEIAVSLADSAWPRAGLPDGVLATVDLQAVCRPDGAGPIAAVGFAADPPAVFSDLASQTMPGFTMDGSIVIVPGLPGDCNGDAAVDADDISASVLEIFDGDESWPAAASAGSFAGTAYCDSNQDGVIDAGDIACTALIVFDGPLACRAE